MTNCWRCGRITEDNAPCRWCGADLSTSVPPTEHGGQRCSNCNEWNDASSRWCWECGTRLEPPPAPAPRATYRAARRQRAEETGSSAVRQLPYRAAWESFIRPALGKIGAMPAWAWAIAGVATLVCSLALVFFSSKPADVALPATASGPNGQPTPAAAAPAQTPATAPQSPTPVPGTATPASRDYVVANTGGSGVYIRKSAADPTSRIKLWPEKTLMVEIGVSGTADGRTWRNVRDPDGNQGWVPSEFLAPAP